MNTPYTRLTLAEREEISRGIYACEKFAAIARRLNRPTSTVSNEVWRNTGYSWCYRAGKAQERANGKKRKGRPRKLDTNTELRSYIYEKLKIQWSPEEIAKRLEKEYPERKDMRISHETIYQHLYCLPRGELKDFIFQYLKQSDQREYLIQHISHNNLQASVLGRIQFFFWTIGYLFLLFYLIWPYDWLFATGNALIIIAIIFAAMNIFEAFQKFLPKKI